MLMWKEIKKFSKNLIFALTPLRIWLNPAQAPRGLNFLTRSVAAGAILDTDFAEKAAKSTDFERGFWLSRGGIRVVQMLYFVFTITYLSYYIFSKSIDNIMD